MEPRDLGYMSRALFYDPDNKPDTPEFTVSFVDRDIIYHWSSYEGATLPFISTGPKKYTHHPIAVIYEIMDDKSFRHLTREMICDLVMKYGSHRIQSWRGLDYSLLNRLGYALDDIEINPYETKKSIAVLGGLSCHFCNDLCWAGSNPDENYCETHDRYQKWSFERDEMSRKIINLFHSPWEIVCDSCLILASRGYRHGHKHLDWKANDILALYGLLEILTTKIPKKQTRKKRNGPYSIAHAAQH